MCSNLKAANPCFLETEFIQRLSESAFLTASSTTFNPSAACSDVHHRSSVSMSLTCISCSPLDGRPKPCMRMLLEASRAAPHDLPPDMDFFQVPLKMAHTDAPTTALPLPPTTLPPAPPPLPPLP